jgi:acetyltransferase (GNAT) family protein
MVENSAAFAAQIESVKAYVRLMAGANESSYLIEGDGITASVCPSAPRQARANVVTCSDATQLLGGLESVEHAYAAAGITSWHLWDAAGADENRLKEAGYRYVRHAPGMSIDLEDLTKEVKLGGFHWEEHEDLEVVGRVNEARYPDGAGLAAALSRIPEHQEVTVYEAVVGGRTGAALCVVYQPGGDMTAFFLATNPTNREARNREIGRKLYFAALCDAQHRGYETASLQASAKGQPIYQSFGFRPVSPKLFALYRRDVPQSA